MIRYVKLLQIIPVTIVSWGISSGLTGSIAASIESNAEEVDSIKAEDLLMPGETEIILSESWQFDRKIDDPEEIAQVPLLGLSGWAIGPKAGTLGLGADIVKSILPNLNARVGLSGLDIGVDISSDNIDYEGDVNLGGIPLLVDFYPLFSGFRVTGGLVINNNKIEVDAKGRDEDGSIRIGDRDFTVRDVGDIKGDVEYNDIAPYIGIGFGNPVRPGKSFGFSIDIGVMFQGAGDVSLRATNPSPAALSAGINAQLEREEDDLQDEVDKIQVYPILQIGVTYQF
ncbi:MAG: hypothetical protein AB4352_00405 [Hormoscilla sp.]